MRYDLNARWLFDKDIDPLSKRLSALLRTKYFGSCVVNPRSLKLPPTAANLSALIAKNIKLPPSGCTWAGEHHGKQLSGSVSVSPPGEMRFASSVSIAFSLSGTFQGGPFQNVNEVRDLALQCAKVGPCPFVEVLPRDHDYGIDIDISRKTDTWAVPGIIAWITVLHQDIVTNMDVDLQQAEQVAGVRVGQKGQYWWIVLTPHPYCYSSAADEDVRKRVTDVLDLPAIHARFPE